MTSFTDSIAQSKTPSVQKNLAKLWCRFGFICRAVQLPNMEYAGVNRPKLEKVIREFYQSWTSIFSALNCRPNLHLVSSCRLLQLLVHFPSLITDLFQYLLVFSKNGYFPVLPCSAASRALWSAIEYMVLLSLWGFLQATPAEQCSWYASSDRPNFQQRYVKETTEEVQSSLPTHNAGQTSQRVYLSHWRQVMDGICK